MGKRILIRADDLGYSEGINYGIAKTVGCGIVRSVGLMTNMPLAKQGVELLKGSDVCFGQHTNICVGRPLCDPRLIPSITGPDGEFRKSREYRTAEKDFVVLEEVILEIEEQYQKFKELTGKEPSYFEGHAVSSANFSKGLQIVAKRHGLDYLGFVSEKPLVFRHTEIAAWMESMQADYQPFASLQRCVLKEYKDDECPMFISHPGWLDNYILTHSSLTINRAREAEMLCDPAVREWLADHHVRVVTFDEIR